MKGQVIVVSKAEDIPLTANKPTLVYWNIIGLANSLRMTLALATGDVDFVDVRIDNAVEGARDEWFKAKADLTMKVPFPNLPYYVDSKVGISQSDAILRYLGRTHNLMGAPGQEHLVDQALDELKDYEGTIAMHSYRTGPEQLASWYDSNVRSIVTKWGQFLGKKEYITGGSISIADVKLYCFLYKLTVLQEKLGKESTAEALTGWVSEFMKRVEQVPELKEYFASSDYMRRPLNSPSAKFNN